MQPRTLFTISLLAVLATVLVAQDKEFFKQQPAPDDAKPVLEKVEMLEEKVTKLELRVFALEEKTRLRLVPAK
jgi:hypothetical protein